MKEVIWCWVMSEWCKMEGKGMERTRKGWWKGMWIVKWRKGMEEVWKRKGMEGIRSVSDAEWKRVEEVLELHGGN